MAARGKKNEHRFNRFVRLYEAYLAEPPGYADPKLAAMLRSIERAEARGDVSESEIEVKAEILRRSDRSGRWESILTRAGGEAYESFKLLSAQRQMGFAPGPIQITAADVIFEWSDVAKRDRIFLWLRICYIDSVYLKHISREREK